MLDLNDPLRAFGTPGFGALFKQALARQAALLPLQAGLSAGNYVADGPVSVSINSVAALDDVIRVRAGVFYQSVMGGCSCAGDPTTSGETPEYCEVQLDIDRRTGMATATLLG